jgi:PleD family two-component response regulator
VKSEGAGVMQGKEAPTAESIVVVDDDPFLARLLEIELRAAGYDVRVASDGEQALGLVLDAVPDLVVADVMMPNMDGFELTRRLRQDSRTSGVSIIMLTARGLSADKLEGFSVGADDYIVKPFDTPELLARIRGVLRRAKEMRAQSPLTGLPGNVRTAEEIESRVTSGGVFAILCADIDRFKAYNDHYGFMRGDQVIQFLARLIQDVAVAVAAEGTETFVGHLGGDDFLVVCRTDEAERIAEGIIEGFDRHIGGLYDPEDRERGFIEVANRRGEKRRFGFLTVSIGIATTAWRQFSHYAEIVAVANELKGYTKGAEGSSYAMDRRHG